MSPAILKYLGGADLVGGHDDPTSSTTYLHEVSP